MQEKSSKKRGLKFKAIFRLWWPLAVSWLMMSLQRPLMAAVIARLPDARLNLAAYGGVIWGQVSGIYIGIAGLILANMTQALWLLFRSRGVLVDIKNGELEVET